LDIPALQAGERYLHDWYNSLVNRKPPALTARPPDIASLADLTRIVQTVEGFHPVAAALGNGHGATIDGAWGSSASLAAAALALQARHALLVVIAFPRDIDGWIEDLQGFTGVKPVVFPAWDAMPSGLPGDESSEQAEISGQRLRVLKQLES